MALSFVTSTDIQKQVVVSCDPDVQATVEERAAYLSSGDVNDLGEIGSDATLFTIRALSPAERERAEVQAGAYTRSELGRLLYIEAPTDTEARARWHHELEDDERVALAQYNEYISRVYIEMIRAALVAIDGNEASVDDLDRIRPDENRTHTISELVLHIQRLSLLDSSGK